MPEAHRSHYSLIGRGIKRATLSHPLSYDLSVSSTAASSRMGTINDKPRKEEGQGTEIEVEFRHMDGRFESMTPVDPRSGSSSVNVPIQDGPVSNGNQTLFLKGLKEIAAKERDHYREVHLAQEVDISSGNNFGQDGLLRIGGKKSVSIKDTTATQKEKGRMKEKERVHEEDLVGVTKKSSIPIHLLSAASNINEKSDAFIRRKKEAMTRNYSIDSRRSQSGL